MGSRCYSGNGKLNQVKAHWTPDNHELFIDLCLEQISLGNKPGTHFTHKVWQDLVSNDRMKWDPNARRFGASDQEWDQYLQANPDAAQFRSKELLFADKLDIVYGGTADSEVTERYTRGKKVNCFTGAEPVARRTKATNDAAGKEPPTHTGNHPYGAANTVLHLEEPMGVRPEENVEHCYDAVESRSIITEQSPPLKLSYSIEECIKCLDSIEELERGSELNLFALDLFLKKEYREIFLNLKKSSTRIAWLGRLHSVGPPLPLY